MITFTNKAANEMKERIGREPSKSNNQLGFIGTFHSLAARILRQEGRIIGLTKNFIIYDEEDQLKLIKKIIERKKINDYRPNYYLNRISAAKNQLIMPEKYLESFSDFKAAKVADIYYHYQKELKKNKAVDFDDLLVFVVQIFEKNKPILEKYQNLYQYILVDEFQDTNFVQYRLTWLLGKKNHQLQ
jgi:DNA helicase-2/ATP-dependent DNA helicase PcrA